MNNNETNPLREEPKCCKPIEAGFYPGMGCPVCHKPFRDVLQSQSLPAEQPEKSLQDCKDEVAQKCLEYPEKSPATWKNLSASGKLYVIDDLCELYASQFKQPSQPEDKEVKYRLGRKLNRVILAQDGTKEIAVVTFMPGYEKLAEKVVSILNEHPLHEK